MKMWKRILVLFLAPVFALSSFFSAFALESVEISPMSIVGQNTLLQMRSYLTTQYNNSSSNANISQNAGYLFALKAIAYAIAGTSYSTMDCSKLTYTALKEAYASKALQNYYIFGNTKLSSRQQYSVCVSNNLMITRSDLQTGDLIFWENPSTGVVNHVGIYFKYNGGDYVIESRSPGVVVTDWIWDNDEYKPKYYARINKALTATFKTGAPFREALGTQKVLYNCPPVLPTPPTYSGYTFTSWSPSITAGMRSNTTYTANYVDNNSIMRSAEKYN
ncbi:NlpC/P60 family protein [bacterium]|nr:NlpC/P60 family protein [bacterium]